MRRPVGRDTEKAALWREICRASLVKQELTLGTGRPGAYYLDKYRFETEPALLRRVAEQLAEHVPAGTTRLAGPAVGAVPLVTALSLRTGLAFGIIRKEPKGYGANRLVEGCLAAGDRVTLVDDVVASGSQVVRAAEELRRMGAAVLRILAVIDRSQGAAELARERGFQFQALFELSEWPLPAPVDDIR